MSFISKNTIFEGKKWDIFTKFLNILYNTVIAIVSGSESCLKILKNSPGNISIVLRVWLICSRIYCKPLELTLALPDPLSDRMKRVRNN